MHGPLPDKRTKNPVDHQLLHEHFGTVTKLGSFRHLPHGRAAQSFLREVRSEEVYMRDAADEEV